MIDYSFYKNISNFFWLILLFTSFSCGGTSSEVTIKGSFAGGNHTLILLREASEDVLTTIDSTRTDNQGAFELSVNVDTPTFLLLQAEGEAEPIVLLIEPKENIVISTQKGSFAKSHSISGSKGSRLVYELNLRLNSTVAIIDSLSIHFRSSVDSSNFNQIKKKIDSTYLAALDEHRRFTINFVKENRYSLASILALYQQYDQARSVLNRRKDFELFQLVDSALFPLYPNNPMVANLNSNVKKISAQLRLYDKRNDMLEVGQRLPNLRLPIVGGDTISLWSLSKKYILLDFWATWCDDCRGGNSGLKDLHQRFSGRGFEVVQVAIDDDKELLIKTINTDSIPWFVVSDFLQWDSPILDSLSINAIPSNYLMDKNGVILERNISKSDLEKILHGE
ncbi:MAG: TlpA disulfide reductase family protein [Bacteroidales bacterium]|nr:TlpA disulfide reductase family protein [Bacteroidales bacterium]